jgi:hypothetical protein
MVFQRPNSQASAGPAGRSLVEIFDGIADVVDIVLGE